MEFYKNFIYDGSMEIWQELGNGEKMILAFVFAWAIAQVSKIIIALIKEGDIKSAMKTIFRSGGMPSGHAAAMMALTVSLGVLEGIRTPLFAAVLAITGVVIYDACNVRYAVGENAKILKDLSDKDVQVTEGHTVLQVIVGSVIGVVVGLIVGFC